MIIGDNTSREGSLDEISLKEIFVRIGTLYRYISKRWKFIGFLVAIGASLGFCYSLYSKPVYIAELSFALEDDKSSSNLGGALGLASQFGFDLGGGSGGAFVGDNLLALISSRKIVENALLSEVKLRNNTIVLADLYIGFNNFRQTWREKSELRDLKFSPIKDRLSFSRMQDSILGTFSKSLIENCLQVEKKDKKLSIFLVKVTTRNELFSKLFTEALVREVANFYIQTRTKRSTQNVVLLQFQTDSVRRQLNKAIAGVATSVDANPNSNQALQILRVPSQNKQVDLQANQAILTELVKNLELAKITLRKETPLIQVIDKPILPLRKEAIGKLKGIIMGAAVACFLSVIILVFRYIYHKMASF